MTKRLVILFKFVWFRFQLLQIASILYILTLSWMCTEVCEIHNVFWRIHNKVCLSHCHHRKLKLQSFFMNSHKISNKIRLRCLPFQILFLVLPTSSVISLSSSGKIHPANKYTWRDIYIDIDRQKKDIDKN